MVARHKAVILLLLLSVLTSFCLAETISFDHDNRDLIILSKTFPLSVSFEESSLVDSPQIIFSGEVDFDVRDRGDELEVIPVGNQGTQSNVDSNASSVSRLQANIGALLLTWGLISVLYTRKINMVTFGIVLTVALFAVQHVDSQSNVVRVRIVTPAGYTYRTLEITAIGGQVSDSSLSNLSTGVVVTDLSINLCSGASSVINLSRVNASSSIQLCARTVDLQTFVEPSSLIQIETGDNNDGSINLRVLNSFTGRYYIVGDSVSIDGNDNCNESNQQNVQEGTCGGSGRTSEIRLSANTVTVEFVANVNASSSSTPTNFAEPSPSAAAVSRSETPSNSVTSTVTESSTNSVAASQSGTPQPASSSPSLSVTASRTPSISVTGSVSRSAVAPSTTATLSRSISESRTPVITETRTPQVFFTLTATATPTGSVLASATRTGSVLVSGTGTTSTSVTNTVSGSVSTQVSATTSTSVSTSTSISPSTSVSQSVSPSGTSSDTVSPTPSVTPSSATLCQGPVTDITGNLTRSSLAQIVSTSVNDTLPSGTINYYSFVANYDGFLTVSTCNEQTNIDSLVTVFTGNCITAIAENDDTLCAYNGLLSIVQVEVRAGVRYTVSVEDVSGGNPDEAGQYLVEFELRPNFSPTRCDNAYDITSNLVQSGELMVESPIVSSNTTFYYMLVAPYDGSLTVSTCVDEEMLVAQTAIDVITTCGSESVIENGLIVPAVLSCGVEGFGVSTGVSVTEGVVYRILLTAEEGSFKAAIRLGESRSCQQATDVTSDLAANGTTSVRSQSAGFTTYSVSVPVDSLISVSLCNDYSVGGGYIGLSNSSLCNEDAVPIVSLDGICPSFAYNLTADDVYIITVEAFGPVQLDVRTEPLPTNTDCASGDDISASLVAPGGAQLTGIIAPSQTRTLYYTFTLDEETSMQVSSCNEDNELAVTFTLVDITNTTVPFNSVSTSCAFEFGRSGIAQDLPAGTYCLGVSAVIDDGDQGGYFSVDASLVDVTNASYCDDTGVINNITDISAALNGQGIYQETVTLFGADGATGSSNVYTVYTFTPTRNAVLYLSSCNNDTTTSAQPYTQSDINLVDCRATTGADEIAVLFSCPVVGQGATQYEVTQGVTYFVGFTLPTAGGTIGQTFQLIDAPYTCASAQTLFEGYSQAQGTVATAANPLYFSLELSEDSTVFVTTCGSISEASLSVGILESCVDNFDVTDLVTVSEGVDTRCSFGTNAGSVSFDLPSGVYTVVVLVNTTGTFNEEQFEYLVTLASTPNVAAPDCTVDAVAIPAASVGDRVMALENAVVKEAYTYFFTLALAQDALVRLSTCSGNTVANPIISVREGACDGETLNLLDGPSMSAACPFSGQQGIVEVALLAGEYTIVLDNQQDTGVVEFEVTLLAYPECASPANISEALLFDSMVEYSFGLIDQGQEEPEVAYSFTVVQTSIAYITTCGPATTFDTYVELYTNNNNNGTSTCGEQGVAIATNDDYNAADDVNGLCVGATASQSLIVVRLDAGEYNVVVGTNETAPTDNRYGVAVYLVNVDTVTETSASVNATQLALELDGPPQTFTLELPANETFTGRYYQFTPTSDGFLTVDTCNDFSLEVTTVDTVITIFSTNINNANQTNRVIERVDDSYCTFNPKSALARVEVSANNTYFILVEADNVNTTIDGVIVAAFRLRTNTQLNSCNNAVPVSIFEDFGTVYNDQPAYYLYNATSESTTITTCQDIANVVRGDVTVSLLALSATIDPSLPLCEQNDTSIPVANSNTTFCPGSLSGEASILVAPTEIGRMYVIIVQNANPTESIASYYLDVSASAEFSSDCANPVPVDIADPEINFRTTATPEGTYLTFTSATTQTVAINTCAYDTQVAVTIAVYTDCALAPIATSEDGDPTIVCAYSDELGAIVFTADAGTPYIVELVSTGDASGTVDLFFSLANADAQECATAPSFGTFDSEPTFTQNRQLGITDTVNYFQFTLTEDATIQLSACSEDTSAPTKVTVFTDCDNVADTLVFEPLGYQCELGDLSVGVVDLAAGTYFVSVEATNQPGSFQLDFDVIDPVSTNVDCVTADRLTLEGFGAFTADGASGTITPGAPSTFIITANTTTPIFVSTCERGTTADTLLNVYRVGGEGAVDCSNITLIESYDDGIACVNNNVQAILQFNAVEGETYYIEVAAYTPGEFSLSVQTFQLGEDYPSTASLSCNTSMDLFSSSTLQYGLSQSVAAQGVLLIGQSGFHNFTLTNTTTVSFTTCDSQQLFYGDIELYSLEDGTCEGGSSLVASSHPGYCTYGAARSIEATLGAGTYLLNVTASAQPGRSYSQDGSVYQVTAHFEATQFSSCAEVLDLEALPEADGGFSQGNILLTGALSEFYSFTLADGPALVVASTCNVTTTADTTVTLNKGGCSSPSLTYSVDDSFQCPYGAGAAILTSPLNSGVVGLEVSSEQGGVFVLEVSLLPYPNSRSRAIRIHDAELSTVYQSSGEIINTVWYAFDVSALRQGAQFTISTCGSNTTTTFGEIGDSQAFLEYSAPTSCAGGQSIVVPVPEVGALEGLFYVQLLSSSTGAFTFTLEQQ